MLLAALVLTSCGGGPSPAFTPRGTSTSPTIDKPPRHAPKQTRSGTQASRGGRLRVSTATPYVVQAQPAPGSCHARGSGLFSLPDPRCTPGSIDPAVSQSNIYSTICTRGYTRHVRPPESVSEKEKRASLAAYADSGSLSEYEYDHLVPLELGGSRNDPHNLWPEPGRTPNPKDRLEFKLHDMVCSGTLSLAAAQRQLASDWVSAYRRLIG